MLLRCGLHRRWQVQFGRCDSLLSAEVCAELTEEPPIVAGAAGLPDEGAAGHPRHPSGGAAGRLLHAAGRVGVLWAGRDSRGLWRGSGRRHPLQVWRCLPKCPMLSVIGRTDVDTLPGAALPNLCFLRSFCPLLYRDGLDHWHAPESLASNGHPLQMLPETMALHGAQERWELHRHSSAAMPLPVCRRYLIGTAGVALVPGDAFGAPSCLRISYAASMATLEVAARRVAAALDQKNFS